MANTEIKCDRFADSHNLNHVMSTQTNIISELLNKYYKINISILEPMQVHLYSAKSLTYRGYPYVICVERNGLAFSMGTSRRAITNTDIILFF